MASPHRWPLDLPQTLPQETRGPTPRKNYVETEMDTGPAKRRRRFTAVVQDIDAPEMYLHADQWQSLSAFYGTVLAGGTLSFMWRDPIPGLGDVELRFSGDEPPKPKVMAAGRGRNVYLVALSFEMLP